MSMNDQSTGEVVPERRRMSQLDSATNTRGSYRAMSPSRQLDFPYAVNPAIYTYTRVRRERDRTKEREKTREKRDRAKGGEDDAQEDIDDDLDMMPALPTQPGFPAESVPFESVPGKERVDYYLDSIAHQYYRKKLPSTIHVADHATMQEYDQFPYPTLHALTSSLRISHPFDHWSAKELLQFEAGLTGNGRDLDTVSRIVRTKPTTDVVDMYYQWKKLGHGQIWKSFECVSRNMSHAKLVCWHLAEKKLAGLAPRVQSGSLPEISTGELEAIQMALGGPHTVQQGNKLSRVQRMLAGGKIPLVHGAVGNSKLSQALSKLRKLKLLRGAVSARRLFEALQKCPSARLGSDQPLKEGKDQRMRAMEVKRLEATFRALTERVGLTLLSELELERAKQYHTVAQACAFVADDVADLVHDRTAAHKKALESADAVLKQLKLEPDVHDRVTDVVARLAVRRLWYEQQYNSTQVEKSAVDIAAGERKSRRRSGQPGTVAGMDQPLPKKRRM